jgi:hypothetical protein
MTRAARRALGLLTATATLTMGLALTAGGRSIHSVWPGHKGSGSRHRSLPRYRKSEKVTVPSAAYIPTTRPVNDAHVSAVQ